MPVSKHFSDSKDLKPYVRELQLRREIVATMKLRAAKSCGRGLSVPLADQRASRKDRTTDDGASRQAPGDAQGGRKSAPSPKDIQILAISDYDGLRTSRELVLRRYGYQVISCGSHSVGTELDPVLFQVAILCQSIEATWARRLTGVLKSLNPDLLILRIRPCRFDFETGYDATMEAFEHPDTLLQRVRFLAQRTVNL